MQDHFVSNLFFTLGIIGKIAMAIVAKATGLLSVGLVWVLLCCLAGFFIPMGSTICFAILKLMGLIHLGWLWILIPLVMDAFCLHGLLNIYTGKS